MNKKKISVALIYIIIVAIVSVLFFVIPFKRNAASVLCYVCFIISAIAGFFITDIAFSKGDLRSKFYGFPIFKVGYLYTCAQLVITAAIAVIEMFVPVPVWIAAVLSVLVVGFAGIGVIVTDNSRDIIIAQDDAYKNKTSRMKELRNDIGLIADMCQDEALKSKINKLFEEFKYSDPVSSPETEECEKSIKQEIDALRNLVGEKDEEAAKTADGLFEMLADRNRRCKASKRN